MSTHERTAGGGEVSPSPATKEKNQPKHEREDFREKLKEKVTGEKPLTQEEKKEAAANVAAEPPDGKVRWVKISDLRESPFNPRRLFSDLKELAASLETMGMLQPILARPVDGKLEIVFGHRRFRAAKLAGLKEVPVDVRELTETLAREAQLVENVQRQDVQAMEEAEGYERLHKDHHYTVEQIAEKVGKSRGWVYARMKLLSLCPEARKEMHSGRLNPTVAVPLARISSHKLQAEALCTICPPGWDPQSTRAALDFLQRKFTQTLKAAPFDTKSATLLPEAGSCTKCPKRSGAMPGLFDDLTGHDTCTDTPCFDRKTKAAWELRAGSFKGKEGVKLLSVEAGQREFSGSKLRYNSPYVLAAAPAPGDKKKRTWNQLVRGTDFGTWSGPTTYVLADEKMSPKACFKTEEVLEALAGHFSWAKAELKEARGPSGRTNYSAENDKEQKAQKMRGLTLDKLWRSLLADFKEIEIRDWRMIVSAFCSDDDLPADEKGEPLSHKAAEKWVAEASIKQCQRVLFAAALGSMLHNQWGGYSDRAKDVMKTYGVEIFHLEKEAKAEIEAAEKEAEEKAEAEAKAAAAAKVTPAEAKLDKDLAAYNAEGEELVKEMEKKAKKKAAKKGEARP